MNTQNTIILSAIAVLGLLIIILGFKFESKTRKVVDTLGAVIFHVGLLGIIYHKVELNIFISIVLLVASLFILIDPLKIGQFINHKIYRVFGYLFLLFAVIFSLEYFIQFPVWLWMIPLIIYLLPYLIQPLRKYLKIVFALAWLIVFVYIGVIGYMIYSKYYLTGNLSALTKLIPFQSNEQSELKKTLNIDEAFQDAVNQDEKTIETDHSINFSQKKSSPKISTTKNDDMKTTTHSPAGPLLKSIQNVDEQFMELENKYEKLKEEYDSLNQQNQELKNQIHQQDSKQNAEAL